jgi:hypothetical protein
MCEALAFIGKNRGAVILGKIRRLESARADGAGVPVKDIVNRLYGILTILDAKANGLLRVNSLFLTMLVFFIGWSHASTGFPPQLLVFVPLAYIDTLLLLLSSLLCLLIVAVSWKFLGHVTADSFESEIARLANVVDDRTHFFWLAWWGTIASLLISALWWLYTALQ